MYLPGSAEIKSRRSAIVAKNPIADGLSPPRSNTNTVPRAPLFLRAEIMGQNAERQNQDEKNKSKGQIKLRVIYHFDRIGLVVKQPFQGGLLLALKAWVGQS